jgi:hypothetical protein
MPYPVRCPVCHDVTRVDAPAVGNAVTCPTCATAFRAVPEAKVRSVGPMDLSADGSPPRPIGLLLALALVPFGLPFLWVLAPHLVGFDSFFSVLVAVAIAACTSGLGVGVVLTRDWSGPTRVRALLALSLLAFGTGGFLYFLKKNWIEVVRKQFVRENYLWQVFQPQDQSFKVKMPGPPEPTESPFADWTLDAVRVSERNQDGAKDVYLVAFGAIPVNLRALDEKAWFAKVKQLVAPEDGRTLLDETQVELSHKYPGREYRLVLPDGGTNRVVRVFRVRNLVYLLQVEGAFLPMDHVDVQRNFFGTFTLNDSGK